MQVRCDIDAKLEEDDEEEAILPVFDSLLPSDSVGAKARVLMARGRKLSTIYSKVSAISGNSTISDGQVGAEALPISQSFLLSLPPSSHPTQMLSCVLLPTCLQQSLLGLHSLTGADVKVSVHVMMPWVERIAGGGRGWWVDAIELQAALQPLGGSAAVGGGL